MAQGQGEVVGAREQLDALEALSDSDVQRVLEVWNSSSFLGPRIAFVKTLEEAGFETALAIQLTELAVGFANGAHRVGAYFDDDLLRGVVNNLIEDKDEIAIERLVARTHSLVHARPVEAFVVAMELSKARDRLYVGSEIHIDARFVFPSWSENEAVAVVPMEVLRLTFANHLDEGVRETVEYSLDHSDLLVLKHQIDGALAQLEYIEQASAKDGLGVWNPYSQIGNPIES